MATGLLLSHNVVPRHHRNLVSESMACMGTALLGYADLGLLRKKNRSDLLSKGGWVAKDPDHLGTALYQFPLPLILASEVLCNPVPGDARQHGHCNVVDEDRDDRPEKRVSSGWRLPPSCADGPTNEE